VQIKAVLLHNRYVKISLGPGGRIRTRKVDNLREFVFPRLLATENSLLALLTDQ